jgi:heptosyltransferase-2
LAALLPPDRVRVAQSLPLTDLALLLQQCGQYVGHDSGISHLAAALGVPGILLWGDTRSEVWRPRSQDIHLLTSSGGLSTIPVELVFETIRRHVIGPPTT